MANYNINAVTRRVVYTGSAGTGPYSFTFEVLVQTDLAVYFNSTKLTLTTDYTVTINANGTGSITIVTGTNVPSTPTGSDTITIIGARDIERTTDFVTAGELRAAALNEQLDALTIFDQQIAEENKRQLIAPEYDPAHVDDGGTLDMTLPAKASRLGKLLGFNSSTGNPEATTGRVNTVAVSNVAVDGSGNSQSATVSFNSSTGALSLGVPVGSTGATGSTGSQGPDGVGGLPYTFSTTTTDSDPGAGQIRLNNGTLGSVSQIFIDDSTAASGNPDLSAFILTWDDSTQTSDRGQVTITKKSAQENFATYKISGASTDASGYVKLAVTHVVSNGSFSNSDAVLVSFVRTGNAGSLADPMTTRGDIIIRDSGNATARLAVGGANTVLKSDGTDPSWGYTVGTSANNLVQLDGSAALPAVSGANLTNLPVTDVSADVRFLALQVASDRIGLEDGIADPFSDQTDVAVYVQTDGTTFGDLHPSNNGGIEAVFNGTTDAPAASSGAKSSATNFYVGKQFSSAKVVTGFSVTGSNNVGFYSPNDTATITATLYGKNGTPSSGTDGTVIGSSQSATDANSLALSQSNNGNTTAYTHVWIYVSHNDSADSMYCTDLRYTIAGTSSNEVFNSSGTYYSSSLNMTLLSNAFTADSAPASTIIGVQVVENESITVNTDLTAEVSRDGGTTFTSCTLVLNTTLGATGTKYYESASTDISSQPSGTSMKYRLKTLNNKDIEIHGVALRWS